LREEALTGAIIHFTLGEDIRFEQMSFFQWE